MQYILDEAIVEKFYITSDGLIWQFLRISHLMDHLFYENCCTQESSTYKPFYSKLHGYQEC